MRLPPLGSLRAFEAAARHRSIVAAGDELHVTHGAVSKQVQALERDLDVALFERRNRGIHLTRAGRWLADRLGIVFADLDRAMHDFHRDAMMPGPLTISCEPTLCLRMLIPALADLNAATGLNVRVLAAGGAVDFQRDHVDIAIRRSDFVLPPSTDTTILAPECMGPVMAVSLAAKDMASLPRLHSDTRPDAWDSWQRRSSTIFAGPDIRYEHFYLALQAAEAGQGVAIASEHMVRDAIVANRLRAPCGFIPDGTNYLAVRPANVADDRHEPFIGWLIERLTSIVPASEP